MVKNIIVQKITHDSGVGKRGTWNKIGIMDAEEKWYSTFEPVKTVLTEGGEYVIDYFEKNGFYNLKSIEPVNVTENKTASKNRDGKITRLSCQKVAIEAVEISIKYNKPLEEVLELTTKATDYYQKDADGTEVPF